MAIHEDKPKNMDDLPGTRLARSKNKLWLVVGAECCDGGSWDPPEPPEYWYPVQYAIARTKKDAIRQVVSCPDDGPFNMKGYIDECRGNDVNPMWNLWVQYLMVLPDGLTDIEEALDLLTKDDSPCPENESSTGEA